MSQLSYGYHMDMLRLSFDKGLICFRKRDREGAKTDAGIYCAERVKGEKKERKRKERGMKGIKGIKGMNVVKGHERDEERA